MWRALTTAIWVCALASPQPLHLERDPLYLRRSPASGLTWQKRDQSDHHQHSHQGEQGQQHYQSEPTQLLIRTSRSSRQYDVPQIGELNLDLSTEFYIRHLHNAEN